MSIAKVVIFTPLVFKQTFLEKINNICGKRGAHDNPFGFLQHFYDTKENHIYAIIVARTRRGHYLPSFHRIIKSE